MLHGYIRFIKAGPSLRAQEVALAGVGFDMKDEFAPVYRDGIPRKYAKVKFPELENAVRALYAGDELVISEPSILGGRADHLLRILNMIESKGASLRVVSTDRLYGAKIKEWKAEFMAAAVRQGQVRKGHHALKARTLDKMGGRPPRLKSGTVAYEVAKAAWADPNLSQAKAAEKAGFDASTLYRKFGAKGTPRFGRVSEPKKKPKPKRKRASR